ESPSVGFTLSGTDPISTTRGVRKLGQAIFPRLPLFLAVPRRRARLAVQGRGPQRPRSRSDAEGALDGETRRLKMHATPAPFSTQETRAIFHPRDPAPFSTQGTHLRTKPTAWDQGGSRG